MSSNGRQGNLRLSLLDVLGRNIGGRVDVKMFNQILHDRPVFNGLDASKRNTLPNLFGAPQGNYRVEIKPSAYLPTSCFVTLKADGMTDLKVTCAIDPRRVSGVTFPAFADLPADTQRLLEASNQILGFAGQRGEALYKIGIRQAADYRGCQNNGNWAREAHRSSCQATPPRKVYNGNGVGGQIQATRPFSRL